MARPQRKLAAMFNSSQFTRSTVIAATMIALGATPAMARQADTPPHQAAAAHGTRQWTQPRVDSTGVRAADAPAGAASVQAAPATTATSHSSAREWLLIPLGALAVALLLVLAAARTDWQWVHRLSARAAPRGHS